MNRNRKWKPPAGDNRREVFLLLLVFQMLGDICDLRRNRRTIGHSLAAISEIPIVIVASLLLLSACAGQRPRTATPTRASPPTSTWTPIPTPTPLTLPTSTSVPGVLPPTDLAVHVSGPAQVIPGATAVYTLVVRNGGPALATGVVISDVLSPGLIPLWTEPAHPVCGREGRNVSCDAGLVRDGDAMTATLDLSVGGTSTPVTGTQLAGLSWGFPQPACVIDQTATPSVVRCGLASLQPGADTYVRVGVAADAGTSGALVHSVSIAANETDTNRLNNHAPFTTTVGVKVPVLGESAFGTPAPGTADLVLEAEGPTSVVAGQPFTYTYTITNRGTQDATAVRFENPMPPATVLNAYAPALPLCVQRDDTFLCALRDLESGAVITFSLVITGHSGQPMGMSLDPLMPGWPICTVLKEKPWLHIVSCELGRLRPDQATQVHLALIATGVNDRMMTNAASVSANEADLDPLDNTNTTTITVQVSADVLVRSALAGPAVTGETLSYTLTTVNLGPSDADVRLVDTLPVGTRFVSADSSRGDDCRAERGEPARDTVACNLGRMSRGERVAVGVVVEVDESLTTVEELTHSAQVMVEQNDPDLSNNELTQIIPVSPGGED